MTDFNVGDEVVIINRFAELREPEIHKVVRVTKRFVELTDGSRWQLSGWDRYPASRSALGSPHIEKATDAHREEITRYSALLALERVVKGTVKLPTSVLVEAANVLRRAWEEKRQG